MPILDNFLFSLEGQKLTITASDTEVTMITTMDLETTEGEGLIALPSRILLETLKKFPEQPLNFEIDEETMAVDIVTENGKFSVVGQNGEEFPALPQLDEDKASKVQFAADTLLTGIVKTLFATAEDELRPVMNGILFEFTPDNMTFVASDSHKLVRYQRLDVKTDYQASFVLPKKPASLLKSVLSKEDGEVSVAFDDQNAYFNMQNYRLVCRLVEGNYPSYNAVIPDENPNKVVVDRVDFFNILGRVSLFSSQASNLVKLHLSSNQMVVSAQDLDFSISAFEKLNCQYDGDEMEIGFKSDFLADILENISSNDIVLELSDPARAGIFVPFEKSETEDELMLLMPMMINA